ncbi:MAG: hypothetical protein IPL59_02040 [Candidatus Competibacteraceae bacterium]|nr:hypothetical protein [Candidatus Competibacteraceae bacterium]
MSNEQHYLFAPANQRSRLTNADDARQHRPFKKLAPLLRQAFRYGVEAANRGEDRNPYVPNSHLYHAWVAGWATLARGWSNTDDLRYPDRRNRVHPS